MLSQLAESEPCSGLQFNSGSCLSMVEKCYSPQFSAEMKDFFLERAIQFKQWMVLAKKLLDITHAKSVFYFFSPFLLQFCLMNELKWYHIFYEECLHVKRLVKLSKGVGVGRMDGNSSTASVLILPLTNQVVAGDSLQHRIEMFRI